ncbi:MAG TPA: mannose-1-phosphate guanylyltransferase [Syntrophorhabdaceae bacterium]|nr:mannose-1-phosphate guanylyltransferase [Syntrophorhabdaceae bacterium]HOT42195.1 mannose-1-phosphate guanylyltransferase [Syntrophorhabdaceae bacterium]HPC66864.1 mannose-1-phosphate guanylyltransferase [Syntrophorhabdaceae bacterium]HQE79320.1 mannose-1-phosphate guanylyltransferase [Syntrophorhabdaceae bacterium]HQH42973.1 mannose-1-phosphate guanylyltransferase [Syntrophorhabdaceae bacterium]
MGEGLKESDILENTYVVIMAGGKGERFWPISTELAPKPFIKIINNNSLIQLTVKRINKILPLDRIFVVLGRRHLDIARQQLEGLPEENFIIEPEGRDTAPCIGFSALTLSDKNKDAVMVTLPADQYVMDIDGFNRTITNAVVFAKKGDYLVTIGIKPSRPETGYGYIKANKVFDIYSGVPCYRVERFVEKPNFETAVKYVEEGDYFWNGGIFIWKVGAVLKGIEHHMPELHEGLKNIKDIMKAKTKKGIDDVYRGLPRRSIDYGLMEKAENVLMLKGEFAWDDIGTWQALLRVLETDERGNCVHGDAVLIDTEGSVVYTDGLKAGVMGVSNLVVVASKEGVLVCHRDRSQDVREIARKIEAEKTRQ